jgi:Flp pilus assembly pilin Flp
MIFSDAWRDDSGQDIAEYAVMLAVVVVVTIVTIRAMGGGASTMFSRLASVLDEVK